MCAERQAVTAAGPAFSGSRAWLGPASRCERLSPRGGDHQMPADGPAEPAPDAERRLRGERPEAVGERVVRVDFDVREIAEQLADAAAAEGIDDRAVVLPVVRRLIRQPQRPER